VVLAQFFDDFEDVADAAAGEPVQAVEVETGNAAFRAAWRSFSRPGRARVRALCLSLYHSVIVSRRVRAARSTATRCMSSVWDFELTRM
jgi:hypothetical protein